MIEFFNFT